MKPVYHNSRPGSSRRYIGPQLQEVLGALMAIGGFYVAFYFSNFFGKTACRGVAFLLGGIVIICVGVGFALAPRLDDFRNPRPFKINYEVLVSMLVAIFFAIGGAWFVDTHPEHWASAPLGLIAFFGFLFATLNTMMSTNGQRKMRESLGDWY